MRFFAGGVMFLAAAGFRLTANLIFLRMVDEVNAVLPPTSQIDLMGRPWRAAKILPIHRQYFPNSRSGRQVQWLRWAMLGSFIVALACVVLFR